MTPVLIDTRGWIKFGLFALFFSAIIFSVGFLLGYQDATAYYRTDNKTIPLSLPEEVVAVGDAMEAVIPDVIAEGESIDVDQASVDQVDATIIQVPIINDDAMLKKSGSDQSPHVLQKDPPVVLPGENVAALKSPNGISFTLENVDEIKYSIQVGVYGQLSNAEKITKKLKAEKFDAYVSTYINGNSEIRYNVRLGYFVDKKSALPTLHYFRDAKKSEAYLVKFSADTMINVMTEEFVANAVDDVNAHLDVSADQIRTLPDVRFSSR